MSVRTQAALYQFVVSCTALYPLAYVLAHTSTDHLVPPCTRGTGLGFQMSPSGPGRAECNRELQAGVTMVQPPGTAGLGKFPGHWYCGTESLPNAVTPQPQPDSESVQPSVSRAARPAPALGLSSRCRRSESDRPTESESASAAS